jgi:hypothetical protein
LENLSEINPITRYASDSHCAIKHRGRVVLSLDASAGPSNYT